MDSASPTQPAASIPICTQHAQPGRWECGVCHQPLCPDCQPIAYQNQVFHPACLHKNREQLDNPKKTPLADGPSIGVQVLAWAAISLAVVLVGAALIMLGLAVFSHQAVPMGAWLGQPVTGLDDIPAGRSMVTWAGILTLGAAAAIFFLGIGLLNSSQAARRIILLFSWLEVVVAAFAWLVIAALGKGFWDIPILAIFLIWFFSRKKVKQQFSSKSA